MKPLPAPVRALLQLFSGEAPDPPLGENQQRQLLELADRTHCTLYLEGHATPERLARNAGRHRRLRLAYDEAATALSKNGIEFLLLKGFTHAVDSGLDPARRYQSDLDMLCLPEDTARARAALQQIGYADHGRAALSDHHARPLVKPFRWQWRGDYFDPDMPISIELHHTLWNSARDRIGIPPVHQFWSRRTLLAAEGRMIPALAEADRMAFGALHVLRHILRNDASPAHVFELAQTLNLHADHRKFWQEWTRIHDPQCRALQAVAFQFARCWFSCSLSPVAEQEWQALSPSVHAWFREWAFSPLVNLVQPNKDVLWLHMALLPRRRDRFAVAFGKLIPMRLPRSADRIRYHAVALARVLTAGSRRRATAPSTASHTSD